VSQNARGRAHAKKQVEAKVTRQVEVKAKVE
jgi:hypothetical protein